MMFRQLNYEVIQSHLNENVEHISKRESDLHEYALFQVASTGMCNKTIIKRKFKIKYSFFFRCFFFRYFCFDLF
jgi:hypothetical protein